MKKPGTRFPHLIAAAVAIAAVSGLASPDSTHVIDRRGSHESPRAAAERGAAAVGACCTGGAPPCPADLNDSGAVDVQDLLILLSAWGPCADCNDCPADLNGSCTVDVQDLLILLSSWGPCPQALGAGCSQLTTAECSAAGGVFLGEGIPCENVVCAPVPAALEFRQLDFTNRDMTRPFSNWGSLFITYQATDEPLFLNLAIEIAAATPDPAWQIQNMPLLSAEAPGGPGAAGVPDGLRTLMYSFDLGNTIGDQVTIVDYGVSISDAPAGEPAIDRVAAVQPLAVTMETGRHGEPLAFFDPEPLIFPTSALLDGEAGAQQEHTNNGMPNQPAGLDECSPTAVSNSLKFLNGEHGMNLPEGATDIDPMKDATGWAPDGSEPDWPGWKNTFMQEQGYQIETINNATIQQVIAALDANHDVEIDSPNHTAVVVGVTRTKGNDREYAISVAHDIVQDGTAGERNQVVQQGTLNKNTGAVAGITWIESLDRFVIERPTPAADKTCRQAAATLQWALEHLQAMPALIAELTALVNDPTADPATVAQKLNEAKARLEKAIALLNKARTTFANAAGGPHCPSPEALQAILDAIDAALKQLKAALAAIENVINNPDMPSEQKREQLGEAGTGISGAAEGVGAVISDHFGCLQLARSLQRARRTLDIVHGIMDRLPGMVNAPDPDAALIAAMRNRAKAQIKEAMNRIAQVRAAMQAMIDAGGGGGDCPPVESLQQMVPQLDQAMQQLGQANAMLQQVIDNPNMPPNQQKLVYGNIRNLVNQARNTLGGIINQLLG